ncbi:TIGR03086 family metal-binding protein [Gordonia neofelifaecis]|uniref:Mycothiol-dependent maleylpyruvate isomerase metal-binding domain-containing protein n=1 Tax=Gordonia neofelifaecis NRRL B-59395 TaxID=644548 RepID=F1YNA0_9ACTN|nr:TIGR03086 family metal-binding protein [Gordonia neofelifaecis]EGD53811.1 hypothetical protein SCNU_16993 [Gordonia neofelifaecis NRRL B-59395]
METSVALNQTLNDLADLLDSAADTPATAPTPCSDFDFQTLRHHVVGWLSAFADGYTSADHLCGDPGAVTVTGTGAEQVRALAGRLDEVLPAATADPVRIGDSAMPGDMALSMMLWEYQVHGWDLARAAGENWSPADAGVEASLQFAPNMLSPDFQGEGKPFGVSVPVADDAPAIDRLVGLSGRDPNWTVA